jgi:hypothetical protein
MGQSIACTSDNSYAYTIFHNKLRSPFAHNVPKPYLAVRKFKIFSPKLPRSLNTSSLITVIKELPLRVHITDIERQVVGYGYHIVW